jgi:aldose 1-epimerase
MSSRIGRTGTQGSGNVVSEYLCGNEQLRFGVLNYGARITFIECRLPNGNWHPLTLGYDTIDAWLKDRTAMGASIGRYANRIRGAAFQLDDMVYHLDRNHGEHHIHGGRQGFSQRIWDAELLDHGMRFTIDSSDGEQGYPGELSLELGFTLSGNRLLMSAQATTSAATYINFTNHTYFNLSGDERNVADHVLGISADRIVEFDDDSLPTGKLIEVADTPFDFRVPQRIGERIDDRHPLKPDGYDHCYAFDNDGALTQVASLATEQVTLLLSTTEPGVQLYTANHLKIPRSGVCLETQHFPDSPNMPMFPSTRLDPGEVFQTVTQYQFQAS